MSIDREELSERLDAEEIRETVEDRLDPEAARTRLDAFYARYFLPPSVTDDATGEPDPAIEAGTRQDDRDRFDFGAWLAEGRATGPAAPPAEARVVTDSVTGAVGSATETTGSSAEVRDGVAATYEGFDFTGWLTAGESFDPVEVLDAGTDGEPVTTEETVQPERPTAPGPTFGLHPVKAATFALFVAVVTVVALTVGGALPTLGPAVGLAP